MAIRKQKRPQWTRSQLIIFAVMAGFAVIALTIGILTEKKTPTVTAGAPSIAVTTEAATTEAAATTAPGTPAATSSSTASQPPDQPLTKKNSAALRKVLAADDDSDLFSSFANEHAGETIRFNGVIAALGLYRDSTTRYSVLILPGNSEAGSGGPNFHFTDVNITNDLHLAGDDIPDRIGVGQKVRVTAKVVAFSEQQDLFELEPVITEIR